MTQDQISEILLAIFKKHGIEQEVPKAALNDILDFLYVLGQTARIEEQTAALRKLCNHPKTRPCQDNYDGVPQNYWDECLVCGATMNHAAAKYC